MVHIMPIHYIFYNELKLWDNLITSVKFTGIIKCTKKIKLKFDLQPQMLILNIFDVSAWDSYSYKTVLEFKYITVWITVLYRHVMRQVFTQVLHRFYTQVFSVTSVWFHSQTLWIIIQVNLNSHTLLKVSTFPLSRLTDD